MLKLIRKIMPLHSFILLVNDIVVLSIVILFAGSRIPTWSRVHDYTILGYLGFVCSYIAISHILNMYKYQVVLNYLDHLGSFFKVAILHMTLVIYGCFFISSRIQRPLVLDIYILLIILFVITRIVIIPNIYFWLVKISTIKQNLIIIGAGFRARQIARELTLDKANYYKIIGYLDDMDEKQGKEYEGYPVLDKIENVTKIVEKYHVNDIFIAINNLTDVRLEEIVETCKDTGKPIHIHSTMYNIVHQKLFVEEISSTTAFRIVPNKVMPYYKYIKRLMDVLLSLFLIIVFSPIWLTLYLIVRFTSSGPGFYKANVIGKDQKYFTMLKFRSMYYGASIKSHVDRAEKMIKGNEAVDKDENDPRITPFGKFMRKFSIDEFPQLISVLKGDMSLVGPRPCVPYELEQMKEWHKKRFSVIPGMTGLWQIKGRAEVKFNEQIVLDLYYIEKRSISLDTEILAKTLSVVIFGNGGK